MKKNNIAELLKEILKFRDNPHSGTDKLDPPPASAYSLCCRDWTEKRLLVE